MQKSKGSALAYSLIILAIMLFIASSISVNTVIEKKNASSTNFSMQSYQTADSGFQLALKVIRANSGQQLGSLFTCSGGKFTELPDPALSDAKYILSFKTATGNADCTTLASAVTSIKSIGTYKNTARAVEVTVSVGCPSGDVQDLNYSSNNITYKTVTAKDGKCWLDRNLGATQVATSFDDYKAYGSLFQWGRLADGHQLINWTNSTTGTAVNGKTATLATNDIPYTSPNGLFITNTNVPFDWNSNNNNNRWATGANNPCPTGFRLPTSAEWATLISSSAENITNTASAFSSTLKLTPAGLRTYAGTLFDNGTDAFYWSSSISISNNPSDLSFNSLAASTSINGRVGGLSVRCIKD